MEGGRLDKVWKEVDWIRCGKQLQKNFLEK